MKNQERMSFVYQSDNRSISTSSINASQSPKINISNSPLLQKVRGKMSLQNFPPSPTINTLPQNITLSSGIGSSDLFNGRTVSSTPSSPKVEIKKDTLKFRYVWPVHVSLRRLSSFEYAIFHISPKFATVYERISFQWTLKIHGKANLGNDEEENEDLEGEDDYVAVAIYYLDGPSNDVTLRARVRILTDGTDDSSDETVIEEKCCVKATKGVETELIQSDRASISRYIKDNVGKEIKLALLMEIYEDVFDKNTYLNMTSPTPFSSFLTANYRARASSFLYKKKKPTSSRSSFSFRTHRGRNKYSNISCWNKLDYEKIFNQVMAKERELRERVALQNQKNDSSEDEVANCKPEKDKKLRVSINLGRKDSEEDIEKHYQCGTEEVASEHSVLFKKLLIACCESCERRASICVQQSDDGTDDNEKDNIENAEKKSLSDIDEDDDVDDSSAPFECCEESQVEVHDAMANMYFTKVALPLMEFIEDFADFLIDAEINDLPVLKKACERYLCTELITKKDIKTSIILDFLFLSMVFQLPVMKSMTLCESTERYKEIRDVEALMKLEEYQEIDKRIRSMSERNLPELIDEIKKFREQKMRVQRVPKKFST
uniref:BTB domain-containing protein n=1 Tax=Strongyloides papillosus TaxID=174720 RepID=A0A0N5CDF0_STREA